jgi:uncharacterized protein (DUF2062 family)
LRDGELPGASGARRAEGAPASRNREEPPRGGGGEGGEPELEPARVPATPRRRGVRRALLELLYKLRTEGESPGRMAAAVGVGVFIGTSPWYGLHLALCIVAARIFRLNQFVTYLAAHVSLPGVWPLLVLGEIQFGRWLRGKPPLPLALESFKELDSLVEVRQFGADLVLGSAVVGAVLAAVFAWLTYRFARRSRLRAGSPLGRLLEETSRRYVEAGVFAWEFARAKLRYDPMYFALLEGGRLPREGALLDLGCGRGLLLALVAAARAQAALGQYPESWVPPPLGRLRGIEVHPKRAREARVALGEEADIRVGDLRDEIPAEMSPARTVLLLDVLHYLGAEEQERLLDRAAAALEPGGKLVVREADADGGAAFRRTRAAERLCAIGRGHFRQKFHFRSVKEWEEMLRSRCLEVQAVPMSGGTPYANVLIEGERSASAS